MGTLIIDPTSNGQYAPRITIPGPWRDMRQIRAANIARGGYWFDPAQMCANGTASRPGNAVYGGRLFVSSETYDRCMEQLLDGTFKWGKYPRSWTVYYCTDDRRIAVVPLREGVAGFGLGQYATSREAIAAARELVRRAAGDVEVVVSYY